MQAFGHHDGDAGTATGLDGTSVRHLSMRLGRGDLLMQSLSSQAFVAGQRDPEDGSIAHPPHDKTPRGVRSRRAGPMRKRGVHRRYPPWLVATSDSLFPKRKGQLVKLASTSQNHPALPVSS